MEKQLTDVEVRVLGSLIEKEHATPDQYPLSLNSLVLACNQKTSRNPVVNYNEETVREALKRLNQLGLVKISSGPKQRVRKYLHNFKDVYFVNQPELAAMCVLMLRGPQTVGEIRQRSERIHEFASIEAVQEALDSLMDRREPLVTLLPKQPGQKEARYAHLLCGEPQIPAEIPSVQNASAKNSDLEERVEKLEKMVAFLAEQLGLEIPEDF
ncbi:MAG: YceH family protein [Calditrichia bacterium]